MQNYFSIARATDSFFHGSLPVQPGSGIDMFELWRDHPGSGMSSRPRLVHVARPDADPHGSARNVVTTGAGPDDLAAVVSFLEVAPPGRPTARAAPRAASTAGTGPFKWSGCSLATSSARACCSCQHTARCRPAVPPASGTPSARATGDPTKGHGHGPAGSLGTDTGPQRCAPGTAGRVHPCGLDEAPGRGTMTSDAPPTRPNARPDRGRRR